MRNVRLFVVALGCLLALSAVSLRADVKSEERMQFQLGGMLGKVFNLFGGKDAREGTVSTVALKGSRLATINDTTGQIIDLGEEKLYDLDIKRKTYRVVTFAELRQRMEEAKAKAEKAAQEQQANQQAAPPPQQSGQKLEDVMEIDLDVKKTGQTRMINGFNTSQVMVIVTVREKGKTLDQSGGLQITTDMWMAPQVAAMKEVGDFMLQYAQKMYGPMITGASPQDMAAATAMYPMLKPALEKMNAEKTKVEGTAILTTLTVDAVKSAEQLAAEQKQNEQANKPSVSGGVGGLLGGLAKRAAQKKVEGNDGPQARAMIMTSTNQVLKIATDVSAADVAVPAGFKQQ